MILAGDIGGTNTRLALFEGTPDRLRPLSIEVFPSPQFSGPAEIVRKYFANREKQPVQAAAFGLPGAVVDGRVETTNLPWVVDSRHLSAELGLDRVELINDLFAAVERAQAGARTPRAEAQPNSGYRAGEKSESKQFPQPPGLSPADWNLGLLLVVHAQLVRALEPRNDFADAVDVHQVRTVRPPEKIRV